MQFGQFFLAEVFGVGETVLGTLNCNNQFGQFDLHGEGIAIWVFWMRNTIKNVTMVVPVLMTSCQVSLYSKRVPVAAHATTIRTAAMKTTGLPQVVAALRAKASNHSLRSGKLRWFFGDAVAMAP